MQSISLQNWSRAAGNFGGIRQSGPGWNHTCVMEEMLEYADLPCLSYPEASLVQELGSCEWFLCPHQIIKSNACNMEQL